jgi:hypothetical protein
MCPEALAPYVKEDEAKGMDKRLEKEGRHAESVEVVVSVVSVESQAFSASRESFNPILVAYRAARAERHVATF